MKRMIIILIAFILMPCGIVLKAQESPAFSGVIAGTFVGNQDFKDWAGGLQMGTEIGIDGRRMLSVRTLYNKWRFGEGEIESIQIAALLKWHVGKNFSFYTLMGADAWMDGAPTGTDFMTGFGFSWMFYKADGAEWLIPFTTSTFLESQFSDINSVGNQVRINFGFKFTRPVHR